MQKVIDFVSNNPGFVSAIVVVAESVIMPIVPVKWNGLAVFLFGLTKRKGK